jgi:cysteine synthase
LNPFGSVKDRVSLRSELAELLLPFRARLTPPSASVITQAEDQGLIHPHTGSCIFEGTSGSTGISIAGIARARGYKARELSSRWADKAKLGADLSILADIVLPDDVAKEKVQLLEALGAEVEKGESSLPR